ncbi:hypothetical protein BANRA_05572 [Klebsiella pneumoniae]|nr:hypothetical protein BANRA_05572 [Klebsiella pneumoniae]
MDNLNKIYSSIPVLERNKRLKLSRQKIRCLLLSRFYVWFCRIISVVKPCFFNVFTDLLTPEKLESANNIINQWNVLMYFVFFSLSIGCLATALLGYSLPN